MITEYQSGDLHLRDDKIVGVHVTKSSYFSDSRRELITVVKIYIDHQEFVVNLSEPEIEDLLEGFHDVQVKKESTDPREHDGEDGQAVEDGEPQEAPQAGEEIYLPG